MSDMGAAAYKNRSYNSCHCVTKTEEPVLFLAGSTLVLCDGLRIARKLQTGPSGFKGYGDLSNTVLYLIFFILLNLTVSANNYSVTEQFQREGLASTSPAKSL